MAKPGYRIYPDNANVLNNNFASVATSDTLIVNRNDSRNGLFITNDGANKVYISFGTSVAVAGSGITLEPNGGMISIDAGSIWCGQVRGIAVGGTSNVSFTEY